MEELKISKKTLEVSRGFTYTYYTSPAQGSKPTIMLFHGWPDTARIWAGFINNYLVPNGFGVVALDCLGYGGTSKPTDPQDYVWHLMTADVVEILNAENLDSVVSMGHDWGSGLCQYLKILYPSRVCGLVMVNVPYSPPSGDFDLETVNSRTKQAFGRGLFEYWHFFGSEEGPAIMNKNLESVYTMAFSDPETWKDNWTTPGGAAKYISEGRTQPTLEYATPEHKADFMERFGEAPGFHASNCWYKASVYKLNNEQVKLVKKENLKVTVPAMFWGAEQDYVCRHELNQMSIDAGLLPDFKSVVRDGGHWALLESPALFGQDVLEWLQEKYS
jgi:soluble epoxide hydrolase / lipid-phosphate phosphatase